MPTYDALDPFWDEFEQLTDERRRAFQTARRAFVEDLTAGRQPRPSLRVKRVALHPGVWELSWAPDGRATFEYGTELIPGQPHIIWRRIGTHDIFRQP